MTSGVFDERATIEPVARDARDGVDTPGLTILYHPDLARIGERAPLPDLRLGKPSVLARQEPCFVPVEGGEARGLDDPCISRRPAHIHHDLRARRFTFDPRNTLAAIGGETVVAPRVLTYDDLDDGVAIELAGRVVVLLHWIGGAPPARDDLRLVGANHAIEELRRDIHRVADLDVPVLVRGETGTGKELVARAVHAASGRSSGPFISVNVAAIPASTAASALFGHARGAFTGATAVHAGYFAEAAGGTLFLDEIGATPPEVQPLLLRALESLEIQPLGSPTPTRVDVRIVAATDTDLEQAIDEGSFRAAVYHRLEGYQLFVPPLRRRRDDIGRLLVHFVRRELEAIGQGDRLAPPPPGANPWLPAPFVSRLARLDWPGNVRQLRNVVRQFTISSRGLDEVRVDAALERLLDGAVPRAAESPRAGNDVAAPAGGAAALTDADILAALRDSDYRVRGAASALGVSRSALYARIRASERIRQAKDLTSADVAAARDMCAGDLLAMSRHLDVSARALAQRMKQLGLVDR